MMGTSQQTGVQDAKSATPLVVDLRQVLDSLEAIPTQRKSHLRSVLPMRRQASTANALLEPEATLIKLAPLYQRAAASESEDIVECAAILREHAATCPEMRAMALRAVAERLLLLHEPLGRTESVASSIDAVLATPPSSYLFVKDVVRIGSYQAAGLFSNSPVAVAVARKQR